MDQISSQSNTLLIPAAIIVAGALIAGAVYFDSRNASEGVASSQSQNTGQQSKELDKLRPIDSGDHIRGNPNAPVKIVEYSDTECPFCKRFHETLKQVMDEYGESGKVAWVYRHFPLDQLHPIKARNEATALECANELGGNEKFWAYADRLFEITPSNNNLDQAELPNIANYVGLDLDKFNSCLSSGKYAEHIESEVKNALETGGQGTPWSIVFGKNGKKYPLSGAQPYASVKQLIDLALQEK
jgi:protein-disulfide isomerase